MDFSALPPEVISARIHAGPGAESLIEASGAWQRLDTSLEESAGINAGALSSLTEAWQGPSAAAMTESVEPYLSWLRATAQQCQQIAVAAQDAVAAFTSVRAAVVPVALIRANRIRLAQLWAANQFGINLRAIAETEDEYPCGANNSAAMSRYLTASAHATKDEYEDSADESEEPPESPGSGWRERANYDDIELGAELRGTVMKKPPPAG